MQNSQIKEWPGKDTVRTSDSPRQIAAKLNDAAKSRICAKYDNLNPRKRFIPFVAVHEFEALLFSDSRKLAHVLGIDPEQVNAVLTECGSPEQINDSPLTAPSKRLRRWNPDYSKTIDGIAIAREIGIDKMREQCPLFNEWLVQLEQAACIRGI